MILAEWTLQFWNPPKYEKQNFKLINVYETTFRQLISCDLPVIFRQLTLRHTRMWQEGNGGGGEGVNLILQAST
jgi:hypothetical protein